MIRRSTLHEWTWPEAAHPWRHMPRARKGPWDGEPDKRQWIDDATGLPCLMHRAAIGSWCGYVGVSPGHSFYRKPRETIAGMVRGHGGINYAAACQDSDDPAMGVCHLPEPGGTDNVWWIGFDCAHTSDALPGFPHIQSSHKCQYCDVAFVEAEVTKLAADLAKPLSILRAERAASGSALAALVARIVKLSAALVVEPVSGTPGLWLARTAKRRPGLRPAVGAITKQKKGYRWCVYKRDEPVEWHTAPTLGQAMLDFGQDYARKSPALLGDS